MGNRITRTVLFAASAFLSISAFGAGAARFGTLRNSDWVVTNAWQAVSNKTHDLILEIGQSDSMTGIVDRALSYGTENYWTDATGIVWVVVGSTTNIVGRVALTNDIPDSVSADLTPATNYTDAALSALSDTGTVFRAKSMGNADYWQDETGMVWSVQSDWVYTLNGKDYTDSEMDVNFGGGYLFWGVDYPYDFFDGIERRFTGWFVSDGDLTYPLGRLTVQDWQNAATNVHLSFAQYTFTRGGVTARRFGTKIVGRVALTNDISQAISTNNPAFVSAVLAAPLVGADPSDLSEIAEYGSYGTVGAAILALIAGLAALKRRIASAETSISEKASMTDLPYAMVTPGEWVFIGVPEGVTDVGLLWTGTAWDYTYMIGTTAHGGRVIRPITEPPFDGNELSLTFSIESSTVTATRPSLPGHLCDRAVNAVPVSTGTPLTLPALVNAGKARDFLVRLEISGSTVPTITFAAPTGETITYETDGDEFPVPDEAGTWLYSFTETAAGVFAVALKKVSVVTQGGV